MEKLSKLHEEFTCSLVDFFASGRHKLHKKITQLLISPTTLARTKNYGTQEQNRPGKEEKSIHTRAWRR